jgi:hypothetical protein
MTALVACVLAGCAGAGEKPAYVRANTPEAVRKADEAACVKASFGVPEEPARPSTTPAVDRDAVARCMQAKGYTATAPKP